MKRILTLAPVALFALPVGACSKAKGPAEAALKAAEDALKTAKS